MSRPHFRICLEAASGQQSMTCAHPYRPIGMNGVSADDDPPLSYQSLYGRAQHN